MSDLAIVADGLSKTYRIGSSVNPQPTLREALAAGVRNLGRRRPIELFEALRDVSFSIPSGTATAIIGANGAGKSTLLKVLARITRPTAGHAEIHGRVGSLLEVGTGFHPELTGRENTYLSGAILGMTKREIDAKFDEIVEFAQIERFVETPVKRYSSGMYVRLAFSVAAHLEPEILLIDEVLAVGDVNFQRKCLGKMDDVASAGRTVLFVSHNMPAVTRLCSSAIWLAEGRVHDQGAVDDVVSRYLATVASEQADVSVDPDPDRPMRLRRLRVLDREGRTASVSELTNPVTIETVYDINREVSGAHVILMLQTQDGITLLATGDADLAPERLDPRPPGRYTGRVEIPAALLGEGRYSVTASLGIPYVEAFDRHAEIASFEVVDHTSQRRMWQHRRRPGLLGLDLPWDVEREGSAGR